jgi:hypothetical protein
MADYFTRAFLYLPFRSGMAAPGAGIEIPRRKKFEFAVVKM